MREGGAQRRDLRLLVGAVGLSALGDWLALIPLSIYLQERTSSGVVVALLFVAVWSPTIVLAGPAGLLADRIDTRLVLLAVSLAEAVVAVALAFVTGTVPVLVLAALLGAGFALSQPAEFALLPRIAGDAKIAVANARVETARYVGFTAGPLAGGALAAAGGMRVAMLVNATTFVVVAGVAAIVSPRTASRSSADDLERSRARDGIVFLVREPTLAVVMVVAFVSLLFMTASASAEVFFAKDVLRVGDFGYGALIAAWTLGMALGATFVAPRIATASLAIGAVVAIAVQGAGLALPTLWLVAAFAFCGYLVGGLAQGTKNVLVRTLMHARVPQQLHGRVFAAYGAVRNGAELVAVLAGGLLVSVIGARWTLFAAGAFPVVAGLSALVVARSRLSRPLAAEVAT
jgi:MFS family permease